MACFAGMNEMLRRCFGGDNKVKAVEPSSPTHSTVSGVSTRSLSPFGELVEPLDLDAPEPARPMLLFNAPGHAVAQFLSHGDIVHLLYTSKSGQATYSVEGRLLCPWLVFNKSTKADPQELVERVSLPHVTAARFVGTRLCLDELKRQLAAGSNLHQLTRFSAKGCAITVQDVKTLKRAFEGHGVSLLNLERNLLTDDVVEQLVSSVLLKDKHLDTLNIRFNKVGSRGARALAELTDHPSLTILNLKMNSIGVAGAEALARLVEHSRGPLRVLNVRSQAPRLPASIAFNFAQALEVNGRLQRLKLRRNRVDCAGARALADAVQNGAARRSLLELDLQENYVKVEGAVRLSHLCTAPTALEVVYVGGNKFSRGEVLEELVKVGITTLDAKFELAIVDDF